MILQKSEKLRAVKFYLALKEEDIPNYCEETANRFGVSTRTVARWVKRYLAGRPITARLGTLERAFASIDKKNGCWLWRGKIKNGRQVFRVDGQELQANRWLWEFTHGPLDDDEYLYRVCPHKRCVNPDHRRIVWNKKGEKRADMDEVLAERAAYNLGRGRDGTT